MTHENNLAVSGSLESVFQGEGKAQLEEILPHYLRARRWFGGKARTIRRVEIDQAIPFAYASTVAYFTILRVEYARGAHQSYLLPLAFAGGEAARERETATPHAVVAHLQTGILYDAMADPEFAGALLEAIRQGRRFRGELGEVIASPTEAFEPLARSAEGPLEPTLSKAEQSNTSVIFGSQFIMKIYRRLEEGTNPDLEIGRFLVHKGFTHTPPVAGSLESKEDSGELTTLAILQGFVPNQGDAWHYTMRELADYFERVEADPARAQEAIGRYLDSAALLGRRTGELHLTLASDPAPGSASYPDFAPEPITPQYRQSIYESMRGLAMHAFELLQHRLDSLPEVARIEAEELLAERDRLLDRFERVAEGEITSMRIRCHGDYHLGQVLYTGSDFVIIDFEGEPVRSLEERRQKQSPLKDVAGMLRSYHYAAYAALFDGLSGGTIDAQNAGVVEGWAGAWHQQVSQAFLQGYLDATGQAAFLPQTQEELQMLLEAYLLEKAVYELVYELNNRPDWVRIPLQGITQLLNA